MREKREEEEEEKGRRGKKERRRREENVDRCGKDWVCLASSHLVAKVNSFIPDSLYANIFTPAQQYPTP